MASEGEKLEELVPHQESQSPCPNSHKKGNIITVVCISLIQTALSELMVTSQ